MQRYYLVRLIRSQLKKSAPNLAGFSDEDIHQVLTAFAHIMAKECRNPRGVNVRYFGSFKRLPDRRRKTFYNPYKRQHETLTHPEKLRIKFKPSKLFMHEAVKNWEYQHDYGNN